MCWRLLSALLVLLIIPFEASALMTRIKLKWVRNRVVEALHGVVV